MTADFRGMATTEDPHSDGTWPPAMELSILRGVGGGGSPITVIGEGGGVPPRTLTSGQPPAFFCPPPLRRQKPPGEFDLLAFRKGLIERGRGSQRNSPIYPRNHADFRGMATMSRPQTPHSDGTWPPAMELSILRGGGGRGVTYHRDRRGGQKPPGEFDLLAFRKGLIIHRFTLVMTADFRGMATITGTNGR